MSSLKNITVSLDYDYPPGLEISACFTAPWDIDTGDLENCVGDALEYTTEYDAIYLFPVFQELADRYKLQFAVKYSTAFGIRRYLYAGCLWIANRLLKTKGIEEYKNIMRVKYDGF